jgi:hypothetical protein
MACLSPDHRWAPTAATNILWATSELYGWLTDQRTYEGQHKRGWLSALADFELSATQIGPQLRVTLGDDLSAAIVVADGLTTGFASYSPGHLVP